MIRQLFELKSSDRNWRLPVLAGLCVGIPVLAGYLAGMPQAGQLASLSGLVILYIQSQNLARRMITLMACSFGIMFSFSVGIVFGFHPLVAALVLGLYAFLVHLSLFYLNLFRPPGNFFFIMVASVAICMPHDLTAVPAKIGFVGIGTMISCTLGLGYSLLTLKGGGLHETPVQVAKSRSVNFIESATFGMFVGGSLLIAHLLHLQNPYWVPTSCVAVMQGANTRHIWQRSLQRILGTFLGLGLTWLILLLQPTLLVICIGIILLQTLVEWLVVRNYAIAVVFISVLTIFLAESGRSLTANPNALIAARLLDITIGSIMGAIGGWVLYNEHLHFVATRQLRRAKAVLLRRK